MLDAQRPTRDRHRVDATHARYVAAALDRGLDVIVEKPLTTDAEGCAPDRRGRGGAPAGSSSSPSTTATRRATPRSSG